MKNKQKVEYLHTFISLIFRVSLASSIYWYQRRNRSIGILQSQNKIKLYQIQLSKWSIICSIFLAGSTLIWQGVVFLIAGPFGCLKPRPSEFLVLIHWYDKVSTFFISFNQLQDRKPVEIWKLWCHWLKKL